MLMSIIEDECNTSSWNKKVPKRTEFFIWSPRSSGFKVLKVTKLGSFIIVPFFSIISHNLERSSGHHR